MASNQSEHQPQESLDAQERFAPGELSAVEGRTLESHGETAEGTRLIPEKYQTIFTELCQKVAQRDQFARIEEVKKAAEQRFYWRGQFDVCWNEQQGNWEQPGLWGSDGNSGDENDTGDVSLHYPINIYQQYGRGHISVVSEPWKVRMEARKVDSPSALRISSAADAMRDKIEAQNSIKDFRMEAARLSWTDGRVSFYSRWITDGARFGYEDERHSDETEEGIGEAGDPPQKKPRQPKGGEVISAYGVLECKVPINMRDSSQFMFRQLAFEIDIAAAKSMYPWVAKKLQGGQPGPGEYEFDRTTRIACTQGIRSLQQTGDTVESLPTWQRTWFRPSFFTEIGNDQDRQWFMDNYPDGALVEFVGRTYCCSRNESMDDHWEDIHPLPGDGQATPSCGYLLMACQDALLDLTDLKMERAMKSIPAIWVNQMDTGINLQAYSKQKSGPGAHWPFKSDPALPATNLFWAEPTPTVPSDEDAMWNALQTTIPQALTGIYPSALGESDPSNSTLGGIRLLQAASKGQSGVAWSAFREGYAKSMMQLIRIGAYFRASEAEEDGTVQIDETTIDLEDLRDGNWACVPDGDESYPNTHSERKEALQELIQLPFAPALFAGPTASPKNMALAKDLLGLQDLEVPGADSEEKQMSEIKQMLEEPPIPNMQAVTQVALGQKAAAISGQPAAPTPPPEQMLESSVQIDPEVDDSQAEYTACKDWLNSPPGQQAKRDNPEGYLNVRLHMLAHKAQMQKEQQMQQQQAQQNMLLQEQAKHPPKQARPVSESINFKDLGPSGQLQVGQQAGLDLTADVAANLAATHMAPGKQPSPQVPPTKVQ